MDAVFCLLKRRQSAYREIPPGVMRNRIIITCRFCLKNIPTPFGFFHLIFAEFRRRKVKRLYVCSFFLVIYSAKRLSVQTYRKSMKHTRVCSHNNYSPKRETERERERAQRAGTKASFLKVFFVKLFIFNNTFDFVLRV